MRREDEKSGLGSPWVRLDRGGAIRSKTLNRERGEIPQSTQRRSGTTEDTMEHEEQARG